jgi:TRAP-type mannitol/chloroaromatic compound transport system permease large subunit
MHSGAGKFFIDFTMALMGGRSNAAGRTVVLSSFLLGGPSGSGVATTVTIGAVAYPMMAKAGFAKDAAGGLLAAGGLGAILSPPVLGAAAFLIANSEDQLSRCDLDNPTLVSFALSWSSSTPSASAHGPSMSATTCRCGS